MSGRNSSVVEHSHFAGVTQWCSECKRVRKLYGRRDRFTGSLYGDIRGFWVLSPALVERCSGHRWVSK